ncbi:hypothetical protein ZHAS_00008410 [Anopheles sinensis]|uniref:Uncharacterized protein n=1 Tax=Anopheles sinensis TaxID=74873 RepID=A0A084VSD9_ANOSI|nr:hypothetical protein ZHAS_00008410 [Anopheles sinensis]
MCCPRLRGKVLPKRMHTESSLELHQKKPNGVVQMVLSGLVCGYNGSEQITTVSCGKLCGGMHRGSSIGNRFDEGALTEATGSLMF